MDSYKDTTSFLPITVAGVLALYYFKKANSNIIEQKISPPIYTPPTTPQTPQNQPLPLLKQPPPDDLKKFFGRF